MNYAEILHAVRCPATGQRLQAARGHLAPEQSGPSYPIVDGIPILIADAGTRPRPIGDGTHASRPPARHARLRRAAYANPVSERNFQRLARLLREAPETHRPVALVVGGGSPGVGSEALIDDPAVAVLETDLYLGPRTSVVCDVQRLPFADDTFDAVVCQAVLEHVVDPHRAVSEIHRVLRPGGIVYSEVPFMQQVHEGAYDFTRWTLTGHRRLFRFFDELDAGVTAGPLIAVVWALRYLGYCIVGRSPAGRAAVAALGWAGAFLAAPVDRLLLRSAAAADGASGTYFLGRSRPDARSDADILASHRGLNRTPTRTLWGSSGLVEKARIE
jgi:SAM-dependent methyltransferase